MELTGTHQKIASFLQEWKQNEGKIASNGEYKEKEYLTS